MIYYYCNERKNLDDADFLSEFDNIKKVIDRDFSVAWFPHQVSNLKSSDFLIIDIFACHDSQSDLIDNLVTLKNYNGVNPIIYIPKGNIKDSSSIVRELKENDIPVLYKRDFQQEMTKIMHRFYRISPVQAVVEIESESVMNEEVELDTDNELGVSKKERDLIERIMKILEV